jgi:hypothetical protein
MNDKEQAVLFGFSLLAIALVGNAVMAAWRRFTDSRHDRGRRYYLDQRIDRGFGQLRWPNHGRRRKGSGHAASTQSSDRRDRQHQDHNQKRREHQQIFGPHVMASFPATIPHCSAPRLLECRSPTIADEVTLIRR